MTDCIQEGLPFPRCRGRRVEASFSGGDITSNGGVLLLRSSGPGVGVDREGGQGADRCLTLWVKLQAVAPLSQLPPRCLGDRSPAGLFSGAGL